MTVVITGLKLEKRLDFEIIFEFIVYCAKVINESSGQKIFLD